MLQFENDPFSVQVMCTAQMGHSAKNRFVRRPVPSEGRASPPEARR
jgi:hypothetical protein